MKIALFKGRSLSDIVSKINHWVIENERDCEIVDSDVRVEDGLAESAYGIVKYRNHETSVNELVDKGCRMSVVSVVRPNGVTQKLCVKHPHDVSVKDALVDCKMGTHSISVIKSSIVISECDYMDITDDV